MNATQYRQLEEIRQRYLHRKNFVFPLYKRRKSATIKSPGNNVDGGAGSGNFNHAGIPGHRGGSAPGGTKTTRISYKQCSQSGSGGFNMYCALWNATHPNNSYKSADGTTIKMSIGGKSAFGSQNSRGILKYNLGKNVWADVDTGKEYSEYQVLSKAYDAHKAKADVAISINQNKETSKTTQATAQKSKPTDTQATTQKSKPADTQATTQKSKPTDAETTSTTTASGVVQGQDITSSFAIDRSSKLNGVEQVAEVQGYNKAPKVVSTQKEFQAAAQECGFVGFRTVGGGYGKTSKAVCDEYFYQDGIKYNYGGGTAYGYGIYIAASKSLSTSDVKKASNDSWGYGGRQMAFTFTKDFKTINKRTLEQRWRELAPSTKAKYRKDRLEWEKGMTAYAAALGYDGVVNNCRSGCDYIVVFNRSKMIAYKSTNTRRNTANV